MKTAGYIYLILGILSFIGAMTAGNSIFGPCSFIAIGFALIYSANEKDKKESSQTKKEEINNQPEKSKVVVNDSESKSNPNLNKTKLRSYWEQYKASNPNNANEIQSLGVLIANLSDEDAKERIFSLETTARDSCCKIGELKQKTFEHIKSYCTEEYYLLLIESYGKSAITEAKKYNIKLDNTFPVITVEWILEKIKEIENRYSHLSPRTTKNKHELLMTFLLESEDENLLFRKLHIYTSNFPMTEPNLEFLKMIEELFDTHLSIAIQPIYNSLKNNNSQLNQVAINSKIFMIQKEMEKEYESYIEACNNHDISFYVELELAAERAKRKYT